MNEQKNVFIVGLTGQTGAGKTSVSDVFSKKGFKIINADKISRKVVEKGKPCLNDLQNLFGNNIINEDKTLNRSALGEIVFSDRNKLELLNSVIYPYITTEILEAIKKYSASGNKLILLDAPTLFESKADNFCDIIVSVVSDRKNRLKRIMKRDNITKQAAENRINSQHEEEFFRINSDYIIENNGSEQEFHKSAEQTADIIIDYFNHGGTFDE